MDWADDEVTRKLPKEAPIIGICHTITGSSKQHKGFMHYAAKRGWRSCVLNRRGHSGMPLRVPQFSIMGNVDDTVLQVENIRKRYPDNFIGLCGLSAGSASVVSYIGREGNRVSVNAASALCPAWDIRDAFTKLEKKYPFVDKRITKDIQDRFLKPSRNQEALSKMPEVVENAWKAKTIMEFNEAAAPLAGCKDLEHFFTENNPFQFYDGNKTPCLLMCALDDFFSLKENIRYDLINETMNYVTNITDYGSHIGYNEGTVAQGNYMWRTTLDFFDAVMLDSKK